jgi:hypothetical protein
MISPDERLACGHILIIKRLVPYPNNNLMTLMAQKIGFAILWLGFVVYAFGFAPPAQPDTLDLIIKLSSGQWEGINPAIVALFNLMGVWPMIYACLALVDGVGQKVPAWPFVTASFAVGAFALLPYLALRDGVREASLREAFQGNRNPTFNGHKTKLLSVLESPWMGRAIALGTVVLLSYGLLKGDWSDFVQQWQTSQFIHVMSLDFCMLCAIVSPLVRDDMARRGLQNPGLFWFASLVPMLGAAVYLMVRPSLNSAAAESLPT